MADNFDQSALAPNMGVGHRLKAARESAGLSLAQLADRTKIPARMLLLIEAGNFGGLPARTYATGFTRTYARALGLDEAEYVAAVRSELGAGEPAERHVPQTFEPGDPSRVPTARLAWLAGLAALIVLAAGLFFWRSYYSPAVTLPSLLPQEAATGAAVASPAPVALPAAPAPAAGTQALATAPAVPLAAPQAAPRRPDARPAAPAGPHSVMPHSAAPAAEAPVAAPSPASTAQN